MLAMPIHSWTAFGLLIELIGVFCIFIWGPPQPDFTPYTIMRDDSDPDPQALRRKTRYKIMSRLGLGLIALGIAGQLLDAWKG
jgi:hypothetical protein